MANKYLVISPNGWGNVGDDICAFSGRFAIEQADPGAEVIVSRPPMKTELVEWADYIILSGGGILYDRAPKNLENYMQYIDKASELGKKSAVIGVGVQGIVTAEGKKRYLESLSKCDFVSVRTETDRQMLEDIGFKGAVATFDIAFFTAQMVNQINPRLGLRRIYQTQQLLVKIKSSKKPKIGISMINLKLLKRENYGGDYKKFDEGIAKFAKLAQKKFDIFFIQHAKEDGALMRTIARRSKANFVPYKDISNLPSLYELFDNLDLMIGVRLHSIALGVMSATPTIGIGSENAKQLRLARYALPTLEKQFYRFSDVNKLLKTLNQIAKSGKIPLRAISEREKKNIAKLNQKNVELIKQMIS